jgi:hypothetical protein
MTYEELSLYGHLRKDGKMGTITQHIFRHRNLHKASRSIRVRSFITFRDIETHMNHRMFQRLVKDWHGKHTPEETAA